MTSGECTEGLNGSGNVPHLVKTAFTMECAKDGRTGSAVKSSPGTATWSPIGRTERRGFLAPIYSVGTGDPIAQDHRVRDRDHAGPRRRLAYAQRDTAQTGIQTARL